MQYDNSSIIGVLGKPKKWTPTIMLSVLTKYIPGDFEAFDYGFTKSKDKTCYLRLSQFLDPKHVVKCINSINSWRFKNLRAFIPKQLPDLTASKATKMRSNDKLRHYIPTVTGEILIATHKEAMLELQYKYTGLFNISAKYDHKLLTEIARIIFQRLKMIQVQISITRESSFNLSMYYRKTHPHKQDIQIILSALFAAQRAMGVAQTTFKDDELCLPPVIPVDAMPDAEMEEKILNKMTEYINDLMVDEAPVTEEEIARKKVRQQLKNMLPHMPAIIKQVITDNFKSAEKKTHQKCRIYWEPTMPSDAVIIPFLKTFQAMRLSKVDGYFNMFECLCPMHLLDKMLALDGTFLSNAKMIIRISNSIPQFRLPQSFIDELKWSYRIDYKNDAVNEGEENDEKREHDEENDGDANMDVDKVFVKEEWHEPWE